MVTGMAVALMENEGIILIEVRTTTNPDFLSGEGSSKAPFVIGSRLGYDGAASSDSPKFG
jgi:hypothetical protein